MAPEESRLVESVTASLHPPKQDRSVRTMERIVGAALDLMEEVGVDGATVSAIVTRAGASVGSFYARFPSKEDLVEYLRHRVWSDARERWDRALEAEDWSELPLESVVEGVVGLLVKSFQADFRRRRVLGGGLGVAEGQAPRMVEFHEHLLASVRPLFVSHLAEITHPEPEVAIGLGYRFAVGSIREILEVEEVGGQVGGAGSLEVLIPEVARAWKAYLAGGTLDESVPETGEVDFFDPWG